VAATIAEAEPQAQADWLWDNYAEHTGAAPLERGDFGGACAARTHPLSLMHVLCQVTHDTRIAVRCCPGHNLA